jgi:hypothetical protein
VTYAGAELEQQVHACRVLGKLYTSKGLMADSVGIVVDLHHIQQELTKAGSAQLKLKIKRETETLEKVKISTERLKEKKAAHDDLEVKPRGRPIDYKSQIETSENLERTQVAILLDAKNKNDRFHSARRSISDIYPSLFCKSNGPITMPSSLSYLTEFNLC